MNIRIGGLIKIISNKLRRKAEGLKAIKELNELSGTNGYIIGFIGRSNKPIFQKDIENEFGITRSTASKVLTLMEKKGLIKREKVDFDARLRQIVLTTKGMVLHSNVVTELDDFENHILKDFTNDEKEELNRLLCKIYNNLDGGNDKC